jgi:hypothetical protein
MAEADVESNTIESSSDQQPTRRQSRDLEKRRALKSKKSDRINEIRSILGMGRKASKLEVLNAGADICSMAVIGLVIHRPHNF